MKKFLKMTLAVIVGFLLLQVIGFLILAGIAGSIGSSTPSVPSKAVLTLDFSEFTLSEQTKELDPVSTIQGAGKVIGIYDAIKAVKIAANDPAVQFIYMKPDKASGGMAQFEELREALKEFRQQGKAIVTYVENPTNAGYYLASASDKIYMTPHRGGMNMVVGLSSQLYFLKDLLDKLGVNVQLIRHGRYKSAGEMYIRNSISDDNREQYERILGSIWQAWSKDIAESRNISVENFNAMIDNLELNFPEDFLTANLVDELTTKDELSVKIADLYGAKDIKQVKFMSLADYAQVKVVPNYRAKEKIAVIHIEGNLMDGQMREGVVDGDRMGRIISDVRKDSTIKAVVIRVASPGGSVLTAEKIKNEIDLLAQVKPVVASYGDYAASGGYWISANCDRIFTDASTLTGSIGVFSMIPDFSKTVKDVAHVNMTTICSNRHGDMNSLMRPLDKAETAYMQSSVEDIYDRFTGLVAQGRDMSQKEVDEIAQGRVWAGLDAIEIGLADECGGLFDALEYVASVAKTDNNSNLDNWQIVAYPKPLSAIESMMATLSKDKGDFIVSAFAGTPLEKTASAFRDFGEGDYGKVYARLPFDIEIK